MNIFPFYEVKTDKKDKLDLKKEPAIYCDYAYDIERNEFLYQNGAMFLVYKNDALKIWIYKALKTMRYRYLAYSTNFGSEIESLLGKVQSDVLKSEIKRFIIEALMVNPYILEVKDFEFESEKSSITAIFFVKTLYGDIKSKFDIG